MNEALDRVTIQDWESRVAHAERLQENNFVKEIAREDIIESIIINLRDESDTDTTDEEENEDNDDTDDILAVPL